MSRRKIEGPAAPVTVTGVHSGVGGAITDALQERGARKVYAAARDPKTLEVLKQRHGPARPGVVPLCAGAFGRARSLSLI